MTQTTLKNGQLVLYVSPRSSWCYGRVNNVIGRDVTVEACDDPYPGGDIGIITIPIEAIHVIQYISSVDENVDDLLQLAETQEAHLYQNLRRRYYQNTTFTSIGSTEQDRIMVYVNPSNDQISCNQKSEMPLYYNKPEYGIPQHVWEITRRAIDECNRGVDQIIVPSGDSGSGKTEMIRTVVDFICNYTESHDLGKKIDAAYGVLEAFTNATTACSSNASRSAVLTEVFLGQQKSISSAELTLLYLEESRLLPKTLTSSGGQTFHAFYSILSSESACKLFSLDRNASKYTLLNVPEVGAPAPPPPLESEEGSDGGRLSFRYITTCLETLSVKESERWSLWAVVAAVLLLHRVAFVEKSDVLTIVESSKQYLKCAATALGIPAASLESKLLSTTFKIRGETITRRHSERQAHEARDVLCCFLYSSCVAWLVSVINDKLKTNQDIPIPTKSIKLIDVPGLELQRENGLEQLTINNFNEILQHLYNENVLKKDMDECRNEEVSNPNCYVAYQSNAGAVQMISGPGGVLTLMDNCYDPEAEPFELDQKFLLTLTDTFERHKSYTRRQLDKDCFRVNHYAAEVTYTVTNWCSNKVQPSTVDALCNLLATSKDSSVSKMHRHRLDMGNRQGLFSKFTEILRPANVTYNWIRCVKPNVDGKRGLFEGNLVMSQLKSLLILETTSLKSSSYPIREVYQNFVSQFGSILNFNTKSSSPPDIAKSILSFVGISYSGDFAPAQLGKTKIFLKRNAHSILQSARMSSLENHVRILQQFVMAKISCVERNNAHLRCNEEALQKLALTIQQRSALGKTYDKSRCVVLDRENDARINLEMHVVGEWRTLQDEVWESNLIEAEIRNKKERLRREREARERIDKLELQEMAVQEQHRQLQVLKTAMAELENQNVKPIKGINYEASPERVRDNLQLQLSAAEFDRLESLKQEKRVQVREYRLQRMEEEHDKKAKLERNRTRQQTAAHRSLEVKEREQVEKLRRFAQNEEKRRKGYIDVHRTHTALKQANTIDGKIQVVRQRREQLQTKTELAASELRQINDEHQREKQIWRDTVKAIDKKMVHSQKQDDIIQMGNLQKQRETLNKSISKCTHKVMAQKLVDDTVIATALDMERKRIEQQRKRDHDNYRLIQNAEKTILSDHSKRQKSTRLSHYTEADRRTEDAARESQKLATAFIRKDPNKVIPSPIKSPSKSLTPRRISEDTYARLLGETAVRDGILAAISTQVTSSSTNESLSSPSKIYKTVTWK